MSLLEWSVIFGFADVQVFLQQHFQKKKIHLENAAVSIPFFVVCRMECHILLTINVHSGDKAYCK